jgi:hypothetical protein
MPDDPEIERMKVDLARDEFEFEKENFRADDARRAEELAKLKIDREKAELKSADLRVPYTERAEYRTAIFQGRASIVAVIALLASALSLKPLYDAFQAKQAEAVAVAAATLAGEERDTANTERKAAEASVESLNRDNTNVDTAIHKAEAQCAATQITPPSAALQPA